MAKSIHEAKQGGHDVTPLLAREHTTRICYKCKIEKPIADFMVHRRTTPTIAVSCADCRPVVTAEQRMRRIVQHNHQRAHLAGVISTLTADEWQCILDASEGQCDYCGSMVGVDNLTIEHMTPLVRGGSNTVDNVAAVCWDCNVRKPFAKRLY